MRTQICNIEKMAPIVGGAILKHFKCVLLLTLSLMYVHIDFYLRLFPLEVIELDAVLVVLVHRGGEGDDACPPIGVLQLVQQQVR